ncbi:hypothetical protein DPMN_102608 [Dreissena polymorpha]|uniref:Uncharacterized protein n=1 Tax=Dreissena polymorpha TaxID=45954 RepID=A0A9D4RB12_DREPO|nr:hypothetical protein DPMN_102608 [Dreissena polymorpha]
MMETQTDKRKSWRCKHCGKEDWKGRLMGHILRHPVAFDQSMQFQIKRQANSGRPLKNYRKHLTESRQSFATKDMEPVQGLYGCSTMSESLTTGNAGCDEDGLFEPQEEDVLPALLLNNSTTPSSPEPAALSTLQSFQCMTPTSQGFAATPVRGIDEVPRKRARVEGTSSDDTSHEDPSNVVAKAIGEASQIILTALGKSIETSEPTNGLQSNLVTVMKEVQNNVRKIVQKLTSLERKVEIPHPRALMLKSVVSAANRKK